VSPPAVLPTSCFPADRFFRKVCFLSLYYAAFSSPRLGGGNLFFFILPPRSCPSSPRSFPPEILHDRSSCGLQTFFFLLAFSPVPQFSSWSWFKEFLQVFLAVLRGPAPFELQGDGSSLPRSLFYRPSKTFSLHCGASPERVLGLCGFSLKMHPLQLPFRSRPPSKKSTVGPSFSLQLAQRHASHFALSKFAIFLHRCPLPVYKSFFCCAKWPVGSRLDLGGFPSPPPFFHPLSLKFPGLRHSWIRSQRFSSFPPFVSSPSPFPANSFKKLAHLRFEHVRLLRSSRFRKKLVFNPWTAGGLVPQMRSVPWALFQCFPPVARRGF